MPVSTATTVDVSSALVGVLSDIDGLRVYGYAADIARVPCVVVQLPSIDYADPSGGFCGSVWSFPLLVVVARTQDLDAQMKLASLVQQIAQALFDAAIDSVASIEPQLAIPTTVTLSGQELPAYTLRVQIRA